MVLISQFSTAKSFVIDYRRDSQLSYSLLKIAKPHQDELVQKVQDWLERHFHQNIALEDIAEGHLTSQRGP